MPIRPPKTVKPFHWMQALVHAPPSTSHPEWNWAAAHTTCLRETRRVLGRSSDAEDAAQEATFRAWRSRASCRAADRPDAWLATIARREALRLAGGPTTTRLEDRAEPTAPSHEADTLERVSVRQAIADLAPAERSLVFARYWADMTQDQLARALDLPDGTARVRLHRVRAQLRRTLSEQ